MDQNNSPELIRKSIKNLRNSLIFSFLFLVVIAGLFAAQTYAYFWDSEMLSDNQIISGNISLDIIEVDSANQKISNLAPVNFVPGTKIYKAVKVQNDGNVPIFVRIKIEKKILNFEDEMPEGWEDLIICDFNTDDNGSDPWIYSNGYYYYNSKLVPDDITSVLFDKIHFSEQMENEFANKTVQFKVICQAVQVTGNAASPIDAHGWPAEADN